MRKFLVVAAIAAAVPVCAIQAAHAQAGLSSSDPKFDSRRCVASRQKAIKYAQDTGNTRFLTQFAWFAAVGSLAPSGTYDSTPEQQAIERELRKNCVTAKRR